MSFSFFRSYEKRPAGPLLQLLLAQGQPQEPWSVRMRSTSQAHGAATFRRQGVFVRSLARNSIRCIVPNMEEGLKAQGCREKPTARRLRDALSEDAPNTLGAPGAVAALSLRARICSRQPARGPKTKKALGLPIFALCGNLEKGRSCSFINLQK